MNMFVCTHMCSRARTHTHTHTALKHLFNSHHKPMKWVLLLFPIEELEAQRGYLIFSHPDSDWLGSLLCYSANSCFP